MITSEIIGRLGGADVESFPVEESLSGSGKTVTLYTVEVPEGETWLVSVVGTGTPGSTTGNNMPRISIGGKRTPQDSGHMSVANVLTKPGDVILESNSTGTSSFAGHVYTVKL